MNRAIEYEAKGFDGIIQMRIDSSIYHAPDLVHFQVWASRKSVGRRTIVNGCFIRKGMNPHAKGGSMAAQAAHEETGFLVSEMLQNWSEILSVKPERALWFYEVQMVDNDQEAVFACLLRAMQVFDVSEHDKKTLRAVHLHPRRRCTPKKYDWQSLFEDFGFKAASDTVFEQISHFALSWPDDFMVLRKPRKGSFLFQLDSLR